MELIRNLKDVTKNDVKIAGGKGASLGELAQAGLPVPPGFVILALAYERFLKEKKISRDVAEEIKKAFKKLGAKKVAVRSSATAEDSKNAAWAGQLESYLNTMERDLLPNVEKCWESLQTPRAKFYRAENKLTKTKISVAVVVQEMVEAEVAGVAFSVHPVTENKNQMIIEAVSGLGEKLVSGQVTPDSYVIEKDSLKVIEVHKEGKQKLLEKQIKELAKLIIKIERHYGFPVDVEWAYAGKKFYIVQSRPITTLHDTVKGNSKNTQGVWNFLESRHFHRQFVYPFLPVITFESANYCYVKNPLLKTLGIKNPPGFIVVWKDNYEDWGDDSIQKITDTKTIQLLIKENRAVIKKHDKRANKLLNLNYKELTNAQLAGVLKEIDTILVETYHRYIFLIHDYFETDTAELIQTLPEVRVEMSGFVDKFYQCIDRIIDALASRFATIPWQTFMYATIDEITHLLKRPETLLEFKKVYKRHLAFVFDGKKLEIIKDQKEVKKIVSLLKRQEKKVAVDVGELQGVVAFKGKAKGVVLRISEFEYEKVGKVMKGKKNYILVTPMTRPEFVPYLKKAKAIVTDEGGLTCHAAIVARELKIPCIVSTKIATQVFKDGDRVEVDATRGVVTKITA